MSRDRYIPENQDPQSVEKMESRKRERYVTWYVGRVRVGSPESYSTREVSTTEIGGRYFITGDCKR